MPKVGYAAYRTQHLKRITAEAKRIRKARPSIKWTDAIKQASKNVKPAAAKPKAAKAKKPAVRKVKKPSAKKPVQGKLFGVGSSNPNMREITIVGGRLNELSARIESLKRSVKGKPAAEQKLLRNHIVTLRKQFAALKKYFNTLARFKQG